MPKFIGLEINETVVRALELDTNSKKVMVTGLYEVSIPPSQESTNSNEPPTGKISAIKKLLSDNKLQRDRIAISLDAGNAVIREIHLPFKGDDHIRKVIKYELESLIHSFSVDEIIVDYYKVREDDRGTLVLAFALPKSIISKELGILQEIGIDPIFIDLDITSLLNTFYTIGIIETEEPFIILHSSDKFTKLVFIENKKPTYIRSIRASLSDNTSVPQAISNIIDIISKEISRFLLSATTKAPSFIIITTDSTAISEGLQQKTGISVRCAKIPDKNSIEYKIANIPRTESLCVALGSALKCAEIDNVGIDFRKEEFTYKKKFEAIKTPAIVAVSATLLLLTGMLFNILSVKANIEKAYTAVLNSQKEEYKAITKSEPTNSNTIFDDIQRLFKEKTEKIGGGEYPLEKSSLLIWRELYETINKFRQKEIGNKKGGEELYLLLTAISIEQSKGKITLKGEITNRSYADALKKALSENIMFKNAEFPASLDITKDGRVRFTIEIKLEKYKV